MRVFAIVAGVAAFMSQAGAEAQPAQTVSRDVMKFMGRQVTITEATPEHESTPGGFSTVCIAGPPQRQCYSAPEGYRWDATAAPILMQGGNAIFFTAQIRGTGGGGVHFALLLPDGENGLRNLLGLSSGISNLGRHTFLHDAATSEDPIFVTAEYVIGPDESHYSPHRYMIFAYVTKKTELLDGLDYYLDDSYMTTRKYDSESKVDILAAEKTEILSRLRRVEHRRKR